jgi:SAM-dependent methyltransferase
VSAHRDDAGRGPADSFALVADAYERARPEYPVEAVRWLAGEVPRDIVDLGAGTGKLTRMLVAQGHRVTAVEPLQEMLAELERAVPGATAILGSAEAIPLPDAYADVVTAGQAFHWFEEEVALAEIARVLRPGGVLGLVWNARDDRMPWMAELSQALGEESCDWWSDAPPFETGTQFGFIERETFALVQVLDKDRLRDLVLSRSYVAVLADEKRQLLLAEVDDLFDRYATDGKIELPYVTHCFRAGRS